MLGEQYVVAREVWAKSWGVGGVGWAKVWPRDEIAGLCFEVVGAMVQCCHRDPLLT